MDERMRAVLAVLLADSLIGGTPVPKATRVTIRRDDGVSYEWSGDDAQTIAAILGREIINGVRLPVPLTTQDAPPGTERPVGETEH